MERAFHFLSIISLQIILFVGSFDIAYAQCDKQPSNISFSERTTTSIKVKWIDTNPSPQGWEIEVLNFTESPTGVPSHPLLTTKQVVLDGLESGKSYQIYLRTVCSENNYSKWNGPFKFEVALSNPSICNMQLSLKDDNCFFPDRYYIQVSDSGILGEDIFLNKIELIVEHDWPADLKIELYAPNGSKSILSEYNGVVTDDFGDVLDNTCENTCAFSDEACEPIGNGQPPYIGEYIPDTPLSNLFGTQINGLWELRICDNTVNDIGILKFANIVFDESLCQGVQSFSLNNIDANTADVCWEKPSNCMQMRLFYGIAGTPFNTFNTGLIDCDDDCFLLKNLISDTTYEVILQSDCGNINSELSCSTLFNTTCAKVTEVENFNNYPTCEPSCNVSCSIPVSSNWFNVNYENQDWIIYNNPTPTSNTGPPSAYNGNGNYIYTESDPNLCGIGKKSVLVSKCIYVAESNGCSMSFQYYMNGTDLGSLTLEISQNNSKTWNTILYLNGNKSQNWIERVVDLTSYLGKNINLRFSSFGSKGNLSDIAIDEIKFYGPVFVSDQIYYVDADGDGYGDINKSSNFCQVEIPIGFSDIAGDCDDNNPNINPGATEISCNLIDENCNGLDDDEDPNNLINIQINEIKYATCNGTSDGYIDISVQGGNGAPYQISWSNGDQDTLAENLPIGKYAVEVSDQGGCLVRSDSITIGYTNSISTNLISKKNPSCAEAADGFINIAINDGIPPYEILWNDGETTQNITGLSQGFYQATITDSIGCMVSTPIYQLTGTFSLVSGISFKKNNLCFDDENGVLEISTQNGSLPFMYEWSNGESTKSISNLKNGTYTVTVTDANGCISTTSSTINSPDSLYIQTIGTENPTCFGSKNGLIDTKIIGGKVPYTYEWYKDGNIYIDAIAGDNIYNLSPGYYQLAVFDFNGCVAISDSIQITDGNPLTANIDSLINTSCTNSDDGYIKINVTGGKTPIFYSWKGTSSDTTFASNLMAGVYSFTAFDANNCKVTIPNISLQYGNQESDIDINVLKFNKCFGDSIAQLEIKLDNGTPPFDYNWSIGKKIISNELTDTIKNLKSGNYKITITDSDGCVSISEQINIPSLLPISYQVQSIVGNYCFGDTTGSIAVNATGGTGMLSYLWNNNQNSNFITNLASGQYTVTITDENGCNTISNEILVPQPQEITISANRNQPDFGLANGCIYLNINGGTLPYFIDWQDPLIDNELVKCGLGEGVYSIYVTDKNGCKDSIDIVLDHTLSTIQADNFELKIYPNPAREKAYIQANDIIEKITIYNLNGEIIYSQPGNSELIEILLNDYKPGLYLILVKDKNTFYKRKLVIL